MYKSLIIIFIALKAALFAQPSISWQMGLGGAASDNATTLSATPEGGFIIAGYTNSNDGDVTGNHGHYDCWVVNTDSLGAIQWSRTYGGSNDEWPYAIKPCTDGGYIVAGFTTSNDQNVSGFHGDIDAWVVRIKDNGAIKWQKCLGGTGHEEAWSVAQTPDGGFIVAGRSDKVSGDVTKNLGGYDIWVIKLNANGQIVWQKSIGGSAEDTATSVKATEDGGAIVIGESHSIDGDLQIGVHGNGDVWVVKLDKSGNILWEKALGGSFWDRGNDIIPTLDNGYLALGQASSDDGDVSVHYGGFDIWMMKLDSVGNLLWEKSFGGTNQDWGFSIIQKPDGHFIISGQTNSIDGDAIGNHGIKDVILLETDSGGNKIWSKTMGGSDVDGASAICNTNGSGFAFAGYSASTDGDLQVNHGFTDFWIVKLNPTSSPTQEIPSRELNIFPNPTQNTAQIQLPTQARPIALRLFDTFGKEVLQWADFPENGVLDLEHLPTGLYWVQMIDLEGNRFSGKILKQ